MKPRPKAEQLPLVEVPAVAKPRRPRGAAGWPKWKVRTCCILCPFEHVQEVIAPSDHEAKMAAHRALEPMRRATDHRHAFASAVGTP